MGLCRLVRAGLRPRSTAPFVIPSCGGARGSAASACADQGGRPGYLAGEAARLLRSWSCCATSSNGMSFVAVLRGGPPPAPEARAPRPGPPGVAAPRAIRADFRKPFHHAARGSRARRGWRPRRSRLAARLMRCRHGRGAIRGQVQPRSPLHRRRPARDVRGQARSPTGTRGCRPRVIGRARTLARRAPGPCPGSPWRARTRARRRASGPLQPRVRCPARESPSLWPVADPFEALRWVGAEVQLRSPMQVGEAHDRRHRTPTIADLLEQLEGLGQLLSVG